MLISNKSLEKEEVLVIAYQQTKCSKAFGEIYALFYDQIFEYTFKIVKNEADAFDITQETFIKVSEEINKLRQPITFRFWLFRIAKHMCMKKYRKSGNISLVFLEKDNLIENYDTTEAVERNYQFEKLSLVLASLPKEESDLLLAKYADGKSIKEIMAITNLGSSAIKMKLMRAKNKVAQEMRAV